MRWIVAILLLTGVALAQSQQPSPSISAIESRPQQPQTQSAQQPANPDLRGTEQMPLVVKSLKTPKTSEENAQDTKDRDEKTASDWHAIRLGYFTLLVLVLQLVAFIYQGMKLRETVTAMADQSDDMQKSIAESARSATAMEALAINSKSSVEALKERTAQQMRAYVTVIVNTGWVQDRQKQFKFAGTPLIINSGHTPAHDLQYQAKSAILPFPLPDNISLDIPDDAPWKGGAVLGPQQTFIFTELVPDYVPDEEVDAIKSGNGRRVFVWGTVRYRDVFGVIQTTEFSQALFFPGEKVNGAYERRNKAT